MINDINKLEDFTIFEKSDMIYICGVKIVTNPFEEKLSYIADEKVRLEQWF